MVELVAIDLDGTLLTSGKTITQRTKRVLKALISRDVRVVIASARPPRSVAAAYKTLGLTNCVICYNGALIYDPKSKQILAHHPISLDIAKDLINRSRRVYPDILVSVEVLDHWYTDKINNSYQTEVSKQFEPDRLGPIDSWLNCDVTKILLLGEEQYVEQVKNTLMAEFIDKIGMAHGEKHLLQIMARGVSKGQALKAVCNFYNIPLQRTIAIGDAGNDIDMLETAGIGIAMADAPEKVKQIADYITTGNDDDGVAEALEKFVL